MLRTQLRRLGLMAGALALVVLAADPAAAHVTVNPAQVPGGGYAKISFVVPNERDDARTAKVQVTFPETPVLTTVRLERTLGWDYQIQRASVQGSDGTTTEVVRSITWTPQSKQYKVRPDEYVEFELILGRLPASGQISFPAVQTYDSGEVVRWEDPVVPGQPAPAHPAPTLTLVPATAAAANAPANAAAINLVSAESNRPAGSQPAWTLVTVLAALLIAVGVGQWAVTSRRRRADAADL